MKKSLLLIIAGFLFVTAYSQKKKYWSSGGEFILNFARIDNNGNESGNIARFSAFFHLQTAYNINFFQEPGNLFRICSEECWFYLRPPSITGKI